MTMLSWIATETPEGILYSNEVAEEYEIVQKPTGPQEVTDSYFIRRVVAECDDIGPFDTFSEAEDLILKIGAMLVEFEEQAWRIVAAQTLKSLPPGEVHYFAEAVGGGEDDSEVRPDWGAIGEPS